MGNRHRYIMWLVLAGVVMLLGALIVAIAMDVKISTRTSVAILAVCGVISVALIMTSSRIPVGPVAATIELPDDAAGAIGADDGKISNWIFLADSYVKRQEFESAEKLYRRAVEAGHRPAAASLSEVLYELGRDQEAAFYRQMSAEAGD